MTDDINPTRPDVGQPPKPKWTRRRLTLIAAGAASIGGAVAYRFDPDAGRALLRAAVSMVGM